MRFQTHVVLPLVLALAACPKKAEVVAEVAVVADPYPELQCAEDTVKKGLAPPEGYQVWCMFMKPNGQWVNQGGFVDFHKSGAKKTWGEYGLGQKEGTWQTYFESGERSSEGSYSGGRANGLWVDFHANGQKKAEGEKVNGYPDGPWLFWHDNGNKKKEGIYIDREQDGTWLEFDAEGNPNIKRVFKFGRLLTHEEL